MEALTMIRLNDWDSPSVDVVPLFESIDDLSNAYYHGTTLLEIQFTTSIWVNER
jgi:phosphoenolpyruvate carboxylase